MLGRSLATAQTRKSAIAIIILLAAAAVSFGYRHDASPREQASNKLGTARSKATTLPKGPRLTEPESGVIKDAAVQRDAATGRILRVRGRIRMPGAANATAAADRFL